MNQKEDFARREEAVRRREDALRRKDVELQESLIRFNKFLQENENKKNRALKRVIEERRLREMKEGEIEVLQLRMSELKEEEASLHISVKKHQKYRDYLDSVSGEK